MQVRTTGDNSATLCRENRSRKASTPDLSTPVVPQKAAFHTDRMNTDSDDTWLARLGVFRIGAQETLLIAITGLGQVGPRGRLATGATPDLWPRLRDKWLADGTLEERILNHSNRPFLVIDEDAAGAAFSRLTEAQQAQLKRQHQRHYFQFAGQLRQRLHHHADAAHQLAKLELPNFIEAIAGALANREEWSLEFLERLTPFLDVDHQSLRQQLSEQAAALFHEPGSQGWLSTRSNAAEQAIQRGDYPAALISLDAILERLTPPGAQANPRTAYARASHLARRAFCLGQTGNLNEAHDSYRQAEQSLELAEQNIGAADNTQAIDETRITIDLDRASLWMQAGDFQAAFVAGNRALRRAQQWQSWDKMSQIADQLAIVATTINDQGKALAYRKMAARCWRESAAGKASLDSYAALIAQVTGDAKRRRLSKALQVQLEEARASDWLAGAAAIEQLVAGERDESRLSANLGREDFGLLLLLLEQVDS